MNRWLVLGMLTAASVGLGHGSDAGNSPSTPSWLSSYDEARAAAGRTGKPIFAVFR